MKTEMQQLKENADRQKALETAESLSAYMNTLLEGMRDGHRLHMRSAKLELAALGTMIVTLFAPEGYQWLHLIALHLFWFTMIRNWAVIWPEVMRCSYKFDGCIDTLEILGMIDKGDKRRRKSKKYRESYIAKMWEAMKQKQRQEAYA